MIRGIDPEQEEKVIPLRKFIKTGKLDLEAIQPCSGWSWRALNVMSATQSRFIRRAISSMSLIGLKNLENAKGEEEKKAIEEFREVILPKDLTVTRIYETGHYLQPAIPSVPLYIGQELYGLGDTLHGITVKTDDPYGLGPRQSRN